jgi:hypothetical protein
LTINFPANLATTTDFQAYQMAYEFSDFANYYGGLPMGRIYVCAGTNQTAVNNCSATSAEISNNGLIKDDFGDFVLEASDSPIFVIKYNHPLPAGTYYERAVLYAKDPSSASSTLIASSASASFDIIGGAPTQNYSNYQIPTSTLPASVATTTLATDCSDVSWYWYPVCWLFNPTQGVRDVWSDLGPSVKNKPPMGYFYIVQSALTSVSTSTPEVSLPIISEFKTYFLDSFKTGVGVLLFFSLAIYLFKRFKDFEL